MRCMGACWHRPVVGSSHSVGRQPHFAPDRATDGKGKDAFGGVLTRRTSPPCRLAPAKLALLVQNAHPVHMAKTWVPKTDVKFTKAFTKAMRPLLNTKGGRGQGSFRPR